MSSTIYNHRSLQPTVPPAQGPNQHSHVRLNEAVDTIRQEFDVISSDLGILRNQRDEYESKVTSQINELNIVRQSLYELESQHGKIRQTYEEELSRLRGELHALRQGVPTGAPHPPVGPASVGLSGPPAPPPVVTGAPPGPGSYNEPYYSRDREREREKDRERADRERDREIRDRQREERDRDRERPPAEARDSKRIKTERMKGDTRPDHYSPSLQPPNAKLPPVPGAPPALTTFQGPGLPPPPAAHAPYPPGPGNPPPAGPAEPAPASSSTLVPINNAQSGGGQFPDDLDPHNVPPELKKEGSDWFAVFNGKVKRVLDVSLVHTLMHESVVCCVRFSADGKYLATGCNRTAQIYDTKTGAKTCVLTDESAGKAGDLYIRSVCFSPDGKYLATGAEDKQIRIWDIAKKRIRNVFDGHQQEIYSLDFSLDGRLIVSGSGDKTARIWDMVDGSSKVLTINDADPVNNDAGVTSVAISPNGQLVAAGSLDTVVRIWDVGTGSLIERLRGHRDSVYSVAFTPDGKGLVSGSLDKTLKYWDVSGLLAKRKEAAANGKKDDKGSQCTMNFLGHTDYVLSVAVSHDGQWVVSGSKDRGVQFWDSHTATTQCMLQGHKNSVISIDLSPAGSILATGSGDWQARICRPLLFFSFPSIGADHLHLAGSYTNI
ncbi:WD40-repeat-containing domain protein [Suillus placidus]|uniref:WD40-repeat-containing domain protein n=1 Tax=Suillus placidus TaxID=48579 RepID=A0A9P7D358_9AGAM|nr:WD40-repeat-containing domain protein [Suillus placidus]